MECIFSIPIFSTVQSKRGLWRDGSVSDKTTIYFYYGVGFFGRYCCIVFVYHVGRKQENGLVIVVLDLFHKHIINADCTHVDVAISI